MFRALVALLLAALNLLDIAPVRGLDFTHRHSPTTQKYLIEAMGGGVALLDYDNDGRLDIFLVNGGRLDDPAKPALNFAREEPTYWNRLFHQNADGSFTDVTRRAGLHHAGDGNYGMGVAVGDFNNDGFADLYVTNFGQNQMYLNQGDGTFRDVTSEAGTGLNGWSASAGFFDYDNDGLLDLLVTRYLDWTFARHQRCGAPLPAYCRPDKFPPTTNILYRNLGGGKFVDVSNSIGLGTLKGRSLGLGFNDFDGDGWADVFIANDGMEQFLLRNSMGKRFVEQAFESGVALAEDGKSFAGMGVAFDDYDNDGRPDVLVTSLALEKYALFHGEGHGRFSYATLTTGIGTLTTRSSGWGVGFRDFDNDGLKDLFAAQGHVLDNIERIQPDLRYLEVPLLAMNRGDHFSRASLGGNLMAGRGAAFGDLNNDGAMDVVVTVLGARPVVLMGRPGANHWLRLKLTGKRSNRMGLGAKVRVGGQHVYATTSGSYLSASDSRVHFGLGASTEATVDVVWPSGRRQTLEHLRVDREIEVREP